MLRAIGGVIVGYIVMVVVVMAGLSAAYLAMGADKAFQPGTYEVSGLWLVVMFAVGLVAAVVGGYVCAWIARRRTPTVVLAGLVLVLGLLMAVAGAMAPTEGKPTERSGEVGNMEAMKDARTPTWVALINSIVGAAGVLAGARVRGVAPV
jgi:hypothetical protein